MLPVTRLRVRQILHGLNALPDVSLGHAFFGKDLYKSYDRVFSDENGKTFYKNLHKYDKTEESIYVGALGIVAPQLTIELIAEYGSVALVAEVGAILESSGQEAITAVIEEEAAAVVEEGTHLVYNGLDAAGNVKYVGITSRDAAIRFGEHLNSFGSGKEFLRYDVIKGATGLSKFEARLMEQRIINQYGLQKNGGTLLNKINSIAPRKWANYGL